MFIDQSLWCLSLFSVSDDEELLKAESCGICKIGRQA